MFGNNADPEPKGVDEKAAAAPALTAPAPTDPAPSFGGSKNVTNCNNFILFPFIKQF
jgi:hypothetical protein